MKTRKTLTALAALCAMALPVVVVLSCDMVSLDESSFFDSSFYGLAAGTTDGLVGAGADGQLTLVWNAAQNAEHYEVFYGTTSDVRELSPLHVTDTQCVIKNLANNTEYYAWVRAANSTGTGRLAGPVRITPRAALTAPDAPKAPRAQALSEMVVLDWLPAEGAVSYNVWKGTSDNSANAAQCGVNITALTWTVEELVNETTYYFWISAVNEAGESALSAVTAATPSAATTPPVAPTAPVLTAGSGQLTASWQSVSWALWYEVWLGTNENSASASKYGDDVDGTSAVITGLSNGTTYYVWLKAKNNRGISGFSPSENATPTVFDGPPAAPAAPSVTLGSGSVTFSWQAVAGALAYEVWYGTDNNSASAQQYGGDITASLGATIIGLSNGTTYYVWLKAKNNVGTSGFSPAAQAKPIAAASAPTLAVGNGQITVTWTTAAGADSYDIFCGTGANPPASPAQTLSSSPITISSLQNGTTYSVWVRGRNSTGTGTMSAPRSAKPLGNTGTVTIAPGDGKLTASWTAVAGADSYEVYRNTGTSMPETPAQTVTGTSATLTGLVNGTTYYVWVKPRNNYGAGAVSTMTSVIPLGTPAAPTLTADDSKLTVSWQSVTGATQYEVYYGIGTTPEAAATLWTTTASLTTTITDLTNGTTYAVRLKAKNASGVSDYGAAAYAKPTKTVLYKGAEVSPATRIGVYSLEAALTYIAADAMNGDNYFIVLGENQDCAPRTLNYPGKTVGITLMTDGVERTVQLSVNGSLFMINSGATLTLQNNVTLKGRTNNTTSLVGIGTGAFIMNGGKISGNSTTGYGGGGVLAGGTFIMNGGTISGNSASYGGGVYVSGTFIMNGGTISGNSTTGYGGGVFVFLGTFTMYGGTISGNTAARGGGVGGGGSITSTFTMEGGAISGNTAGYGGGVSFYTGTFTMHDGEISSNTAGYGGGVDIYTGHAAVRFIKSTGGVIYGNNAAPALKNNAAGNGDAVYRYTSSKKRNSTIPAGMAFDSSAEISWE